MTPRDDGDETPLTISPSAKSIQQAFAIKLGNAQKETAAPLEPELSGKCESHGVNRKQCGTGSSTVTIDPMGNILPCVQWRRPVGNLHQDRIHEIWSNSARLNDVRETAVKARKLVESFGSSGNLMGYCIGEAVSQTGKPLGVYPIARTQMDSRLKVLLK